MTHTNDASLSSAAAGLFPVPAAACTAIRTFADVERYLVANGPAYLLQAI
jgi:hypothetical protein